jgi:hypothetical protein
MSKLILQFDMPEERQEAEAHMQGPAALDALFTIRQEVFRPARKHGYPDPEIAALIEDIGEDLATELIGKLEGLFNEIVSDFDEV